MGAARAGQRGKKMKPEGSRLDHGDSRIVQWRHGSHVCTFRFSSNYLKKLKETSSIIVLFNPMYLKYYFNMWSI